MTKASVLNAGPGKSCGNRGAWVLVATILGSSLAFIDSTVVNVALPAMQSGLGATIKQAQWVVESYALFLAALLLMLRLFLQHTRGKLCKVSVMFTLTL